MNLLPSKAYAGAQAHTYEKHGKAVGEHCCTPVAERCAFLCARTPSRGKIYYMIVIIGVSCGGGGNNVFVCGCFFVLDLRLSIKCV